MLNISNNSILTRINTERFKSFQQNELPRANRMFSIWLICLLIIIVVVFFLPWTQNVQMKGSMTTYLPEQRPQSVNSVIAGRIEKWYAREGDLVSAGDTIVFLSEIKSAYFDPQLIDRTSNQITAKQSSVRSYKRKVEALDRQIEALGKELEFKKQQLQNKIYQAEFKQKSQEAAVEQLIMGEEIASFQYNRTDTLYQKGIKSLNDLEAKRLKVQEVQAKLITTKNKLQESQNDLSIAQLELQTIEATYRNKIEKITSDKFTTISAMYEAEVGISKMQNQHENYSRRNKMYYVLAPQSGYITEAIKSGIGEMIKAGDQIVTIVPSERELAAELYVRPMDLPLVTLGQEVRLVFDGWQAFIISGWADFSVGTYSGEVVAIDNVPNKKSLYRILIKSNQEDMPFPELLRVGAGVKGIAMLKDVPVWYEVWRQLNGFPADFYQNTIEKKESKFKPPVKSVAK